MPLAIVALAIVRRAAVVLIVAAITLTCRGILLLTWPRCNRLRDKAMNAGCNVWTQRYRCSERLKKVDSSRNRVANDELVNRTRDAIVIWIKVELPKKRSCRDAFLRGIFNLFALLS